VEYFFDRRRLLSGRQLDPDQTIRRVSRSDRYFCHHRHWFMVLAEIPKAKVDIHFFSIALEPLMI